MDASSTHFRSRTAPPLQAPAATLPLVLEEGQALERRGQREDARALYEAFLHGPGAKTASEAAQLLRLVARTYLEGGDEEAAEDCIQAALAVSEQSNDESGRGLAINTLGNIRWASGAHDEAQILFLEARTSAIHVGDGKLAAMTALNLGVIATVRGDDREALHYYESGLRDARGAGLVHGAINALVNLGQLHVHMGRYDEADRSLREAREICNINGDLSRLIWIDLHVSQLRLKQGEQEEARAACERAVTLARQTGDTHADGQAAHIAGIIARVDGNVAKAEEHFLRAETFAVKRSDLILQGETARELADMYRWNGRNRDTLQRLNQAHRIFLQLKARRELADVDRRTAKLEGDFLDVVNKWGDSIESKDVYTQGHCVRVANLACALWSRVCGDDNTSLFWFRIGALLHDVGKLMVPAEVLNKPGKLDDNEWQMIRGHPSAGVELLADIEFPWDVRPIVESHHERWDGRGYPHNLDGESIPLTARVLCIADVYDALTSQRSYKQAFRHDEAMEIMRGDVGRAFDPGLFGAFEEVVHGAWNGIPSVGFSAALSV
jgi:putative nucleotidyltransferase with HDIG domain